jgi:alpha-galactosidase
MPALVVGELGWGNPRPTGLTPDEQTLQLTLWSMAAAPLLLGCDLDRLDPATLDLLTNDEVLDVDQDPLGRAGDRRWKMGGLEVWSRPLWDGTVAVALFNRTNADRQVTARWKDVGVGGEQPVRDLWRHQDLGSFIGSFTAPVPAHGAVMVKVGRPNKEDFE